MNYYPVSLSTGTVDRVFLFVAGCGVLLLLLVTAAMLLLVVRYRRRRHPRSEPVREQPWLEVVWTLLPTLLVLAMFAYGLHGFRLLRGTPAGAMEVQVTGRMWNWSFTYASGRRSDILYVPLGRPVKLQLHSLDVVHGFYIPAFRIKEDVVPGQTNYLWFQPQSMGPADIYCSKYCGREHAFMMAKVVVLPAAEFDRWYAAPETPAQAADPAGLAVLKRYGCLNMACHTTGAAQYPFQVSLRGVYGRPLRLLRDGRELEAVADEAYLRRAIEQPEAEVLKGFDPIMPRVRGISAAEIDEIIAYMKTLQ